MTRTCPVDAAGTMALKNDYKAGSSKSPASAKGNLAYADKDSDGGSLMCLAKKQVEDEAGWCEA